ncbi:MAG: hypothetical protein Kow0077_10330 [Anaerolineae bacterium]
MTSRRLSLRLVAVPVGVLLLAFALRLVNLGGRTLWYDEAFAVLFAEKGPAAMLYGTLTPVAGGAADIHPLLYYTLLNGWIQLVGQSVVAVRLFSVLVGMLSLAVVYRLACEWFGRSTAWVALTIAALTPFAIQYAQEARMYALMSLWLLLATWAFWRGMQSGRWGWWAAFGVWAALAMYTQQLAAFYLAALGLTAIVVRRKRPLLQTAVATGLALLLYAPWLLHLLGQVAKVRAYYWVQRPSLLRPLLTLRSFTTVALDYPAPWSLIGFVVAAVLGVFVVLQVAIRWHRTRSAERRRILWVLWLVWGSVGLMWIASQVVAPVYLDRALLAQGLVWTIAVAWLWRRGGLPRPITAVLVGAWLIVAGVTYSVHVNWRTFPNPPFDAAVAFLRQSAEADAVILHSNKLTMLPMVVYGRDLHQHYMADRPGAGEDTLARPTQEVLGLLATDCLPAAAGGEDSVWFVIFAQEEAQVLALPGVDAHPHLSWLRAHYRQSETTAFEDLLVIHFTDPVPYQPVCEGGVS